MPEGLTDAIEWIKTNPKVFIPAFLFVLVLGIIVGRWFVYAEECHVKGEVAYEGIETLSRIHEDEILRQQAISEHLAELCRSGELDKPVTCAKALAGVEASR
jgi:hypothetical protein